MRSYAWPGNVRELANAVERAVITAGGDEITTADLVLDEEIIEEPSVPVPGMPYAVPQMPQMPHAPIHVGGVVPAAPLPGSGVEPGSIVIPPGDRNLSDIEQLIIRTALDEAGGRKTQAAEMLGINRTTLYNKLRDIEPVGSSDNTTESSDGTVEAAT